MPTDARARTRRRVKLTDHNYWMKTAVILLDGVGRAHKLGKKQD